MSEFAAVTRVEVIDHRESTPVEDRGRVFSAWDVSDVLVSLQDDGRTLKIFVR